MKRFGTLLMLVLAAIQWAGGLDEVAWVKRLE